MNPLLPILLMAALAAAPQTGTLPAGQGDAPGATRYLPGAGGLNGWTVMGEPQIARGDDLYLLIDGAAEIFHEYGFEQAVIQSFKNEDGRTINLEVYQMEDSSGAYGVYTFRTGEGGGKISIGTEGRIEDHYLSFWKGRCIVSVIGFDTDEATIDAVTAIARKVEGCIPEDGSRPRLADALPEDGLRPNGIEYVEGNLALYNHYEFDRVNIFGVSEGVIGRYEDHAVFLFSYEGGEACRSWYQNGVKRLKDNPDIHDHAPHENGITMRDRHGNRLHIEMYHNFIIIILGADTRAERLMETQKAMIDRY